MSNLYTYTLDPAAAKLAEGNQYITRTGKYIGAFTKAEHVITPKGTIGIAFEFESSQGEQASFTLYTRRDDGSTIFGYNQLQAIMTCLRLKELTAPVNKVANVWDSTEGKRVDKPVPQFLELLNKPIGLLLQMEEYRTHQGDYKWRPNFSHCFCAQTELMAGELLAGQDSPQRLEKCVQALADKPFKNKSTAVPFGTNSGGFSEINPPPADLNDDIPF